MRCTWRNAPTCLIAVSRSNSPATTGGWPRWPAPWRSRSSTLRRLARHRVTEAPIFSIIRQVRRASPCARLATQGPDSMQEIPYRRCLTRPAQVLKSFPGGREIREDGGDAGNGEGSRSCASAPRGRERQPRIGVRGGNAHRCRRDANCPPARPPAGSCARASKRGSRTRTRTRSTWSWPRARSTRSMSVSRGR